MTRRRRRGAHIGDRRGARLTLFDPDPRPAQKIEMYSDQLLTRNANRGFRLRVAGRSPSGDAIHSELAGRPFHVEVALLLSAGGVDESAGYAGIRSARAQSCTDPAQKGRSYGAR